MNLSLLFSLPGQKGPASAFILRKKLPWHMAECSYYTVRQWEQESSLSCPKRRCAFMVNHNNRPLVLIVDDEPNFNESIQIALEDTFDVATSLSLSGARESLKEHTPDAVLLDIR